MSDDKNARFEAAVTAMTVPENKFDVTIICTTDDPQAEFWMSKLNVSDDGKQFPLVLGVSEDWAGSGAGNGLGTLYAWKKACDYAQSKYSLDLAALLAKKEISAALFHTAGKGTRMAPMPASENNNKPGVKLPFLSAATGKAITVLESVVQQTGIYASSRKGRLSVFWGDQVFLPSVSFEYKPEHHIDIMCTLLGDSAPTAEEWTAQGLDKYGVIAVMKGEGAINEAAQVEKVDHATATKMLSGLGTIGQVGPSLGSFSLSAAILSALIEEFGTELSEKKAKMDSDPEFWMPLTLSLEDYQFLMTQKGEMTEDESKEHFTRMKAFKDKFDLGDMGLFGAVDVGKDACWWDYGQIKLYSDNSHLILDDANPESALLKKFLSIDHGPVTSEGDLSLTHSYTFSSTLKKGSVKDSLVCETTTNEITADGAIIVNCVAPKITAGKGSILYNLMSTEEIVAEAGQVLVSVDDESGESFVLKSRMEIDGKKAWKKTVEGNELTFEQVMKNNKGSKINKIAENRIAKYAKIAASL